MAFSWIPLHREAIRRILRYQEKQDELLGILHDMKREGLKVISLDDKDSHGSSVPLGLKQANTLGGLLRDFGAGAGAKRAC